MYSCTPANAVATLTGQVTAVAAALMHFSPDMRRPVVAELNDGATDVAPILFRVLRALSDGKEVCVCMCVCAPARACVCLYLCLSVWGCM